MKKYLILSFAALMGAMTFTACGDDNNSTTPPDPGSTIVDDAKYKDKSYGNAAIDACGDVVDEFENANKLIAQSNLSAEQEAYLYQVLSGLVKNVIVPTYTDLADNVEDLEETLNGLTTSTITQTQINQACDDFKAARLHWERSEAFLMGAASDFDIDPTIDSWH